MSRATSVAGHERPHTPIVTEHVRACSEHL